MGNEGGGGANFQTSDDLNIFFGALVVEVDSYRKKTKN